MRHWLCALTLLLCAGTALAGKFSVSADEVRRGLFPAATAFTVVDPRLVAAARRELGRDPDITLVAANFQVQRVMRGEEALGWFITDQVIGKFEKIDYAVALAADGSVMNVRVLKYRESHGHEIAEGDWLAQFPGLNAEAPLRVGRDINGITGATLSAVHVSEGVRRITRLVLVLGRSAAAR